MTGDETEGRSSLPRVSLTAETAAEVWRSALDQMSGMTAEQARQFDRVAISAPNRLVIYFPPAYTLAKSVCERPDHAAKFEKALAEVTGQTVRIEFAVAEDAPPCEVAPQPKRAVSPQQRQREAAERPIVQRAIELFGAQLGPVQPPSDRQ